AREGDPSEWPASLREERSDVRRYESGIAEGVREARGLRFATQVVAVVERDRAALGECDDRFDVARDRDPRTADVFVRILAAKRARVGDSGGHIPVERIVSARLVGDGIDLDAAANELGQNVGGVRHKSDGSRRALSPIAFDASERVVE